MWKWWALGLASAVLFGCSSDKYLYSPAEQANATVNGLPAGHYDLPPERPLGDVVIASPGVVEMKFQENVKTRMLSVRMVVTNNQDDAGWKIDTREVHAIIADVGESAPAYVNTESQQLPVVLVMRGQKRTIDLFYPLPPSADKAKHVPQFDVTWQVHTGVRMVAERTPFERLELEPMFADPYYYYGWGFAPFWWHDPYVPGPIYAIGAPVYWHYVRPVHVQQLHLTPLNPPPGQPPPINPQPER